MADPWGVASVADAPANSNPWGVASVADSNAPPAPLSGSISGSSTAGADVPIPSELQGTGTDAAVESIKRKVLGPNPVDDTLTNIGHHAYNDTVGLAKTVFQPAQNPGESVAEKVMPGGLPLYRAFVEPSIAPAQQAASEFQAGNPNWQKDALSAVPVLGPATRQFSDEYEQKGLLPAVAGAGVDYLAGKALTAGVGRLAKGGTMVPGQNYTQGQHASFSGVLARGSTADKGFFPKDIATDIGSATRQAAADNPAIHDAIMNGTPEESLAGTQALLQKVREGIDAQHAQALGTASSNPINPKPIQDAVTFPQSLAGFAPEDAAAIADLKGRLGNIRTLGGLNDLRMYLNKELSAQFKLNKVAAGNSGAVTGAMEDALKATRNLYYDELEKATGHDFSDLKRQEGSVLKAEEALQNAAPGMAKKQAIAEQPMSAKAAIGEAIQGSHTLSGSPLAGVGQLVAKKVLGQTPMTPIQEGVQHFFRGAENLPPSRTPQFGQYVPTPQPAQPPQAVRVQPQLGPPQPAQIPTPQTVNTMFGGQASVGTTQGNPGVPPPLTAVQQARLAPGQATPQLESGAGNPEYVTPPASYPPLNQATAATNVNAGRPMVRPIARPVEGPNGPVNIPKALPPPETHAFDAQKWQQAHPKGNLKTAIKQAQAKGYRVVNEPTGSPPNPDLAAGNDNPRSGGHASRGGDDFEITDQDHLDSIDRSEEKNLDRAGHTRTAEYDGHKILLLNDDAMSWLDKQDGPQSSFGKMWDKAKADEIEDSIRSMARYKNSSSLHSLANAIKDGRTSSGDLIAIRDRYTEGNGLEKIAQHELFHRAQSVNGILDTEPAKQVFSRMQESDPDAAKLYGNAMDNLHSSGRYGRAEVYTEVPAHIAEGAYNTLGLSLRQAGKVFAAYLREAKSAGADLMEFPGIDSRVAKEISYDKLRGIYPKK